LTKRTGGGCLGGEIGFSAVLPVSDVAWIERAMAEEPFNSRQDEQILREAICPLHAEFKKASAALDHLMRAQSLKDAQTNQPEEPSSGLETPFAVRSRLADLRNELTMRLRAVTYKSRAAKEFLDQVLSLPPYQTREVLSTLMVMFQTVCCESIGHLTGKSRRGPAPDVARHRAIAGVVAQLGDWKVRLEDLARELDELGVGAPYTRMTDHDDRKRRRPSWTHFLNADKRGFIKAIQYSINLARKTLVFLGNSRH
jgi:hypothetical protein